MIKQRADRRSRSSKSTSADMAGVRIRVPGVAGKIEARADMLRRAVAAELERVMAAKAKLMRAAKRVATN